MNRQPLKLLVTLLLLGHLPSAGHAQDRASDSAEVRTSASASRTVRPNRATITLNFSGVDSVPSGAGSRVAMRADSIRKRLAALGIPRDSMLTGSRAYWWRGRVIVDLGPLRCGRVAPNNGCYEQVRDTIYRVAESIEVRISDVSKVGDVIDALLALRITDISPIQFSATDVREAQNAALREATEQARAKAELIAIASGSRLGRILSLSTSADDGGGYRNRAYGELAELSVSGSMESPLGGTRITAPAITISATVFGRWRLEAAK